LGHSVSLKHPDLTILVIVFKVRAAVGPCWSLGETSADAV